MRFLRGLQFAAIILATGCAALQDLNALSAALEQQYHTRPAVALNNGSHLRITFQNIPAGAFVPESVATFAKAHYPRADSLEDITIAYTQVTSTGPLTVTRTEPPSTFVVRNLP